MKHNTKWYEVKFFVIVYVFFMQWISCCAPFLDASVKHGKQIIMINPAGHANDTGRQLRDCVERSETLKIAEYIQSEFEKKGADIRVILTRTSGQERVLFQDASFANRLSADLFISIHLYSEESDKTKIFLYYYVSDPVIDFAKRNFTDLNLVPVLQAHRFNINRTKCIAEHFKYTLSTKSSDYHFEFGGVLGIPVRPLLGIVSPAILFEVGLPYGDCGRSKDIADVIIACIDEPL